MHYKVTKLVARGGESLINTLMVNVYVYSYDEETHTLKISLNIKLLLLAIKCYILIKNVLPSFRFKNLLFPDTVFFFLVGARGGGGVPFVIFVFKKINDTKIKKTNQTMVTAH